MSGKALLIGNSDGIGLATTSRLLERGWQVLGISRSPSPLNDPRYEHVVADVRDAQYLVRLEQAMAESEPPDLCIYCVGIGELLELSDMAREAEIVDVNLLAMIKTAALVIPVMVKRGSGHFIGLSSIGDELLSPEAPSYHASKAGFTNYLESLALATKKRGVKVSNVRFGFVDTKMAKGDFRPFMISVDRAAEHMMTCIERKPMRYTAPWIVIPLVRFRNWMLRLAVLFG
jgi:short-subunit dehydrogenase